MPAAAVFLRRRRGGGLFPSASAAISRVSWPCPALARSGARARSRPQNSPLHAVPDPVRRLLCPRPPRDLRSRMTGLRLAGLAMAAFAAACQPLPHPFAEDRPPAALLKVRGVAGVSIAP